ncbi:MAG: Stf0 family sulfotransferase [Rhodospirillales bacterium]|jgi:LPS sulfotransferase NodH|nr:Stf0 family sulfotransferase [Rhodospirillales bacterium]
MNYIFMRRADRIDQAVSLAVATQTQQWTSGHEAVGKPVYSGDAIEQALRQIQHVENGWERVFERAGVEPYRLTYEDFRHRPDEIIGEIAAYLGVELSPELQIDNLPPIERQSDPIKSEWAARYRAENPSSS